MTTDQSYPYMALDALPPAIFRQVWLDTVFDCFKWDPQVGDVSVLMDFPLVLSAQVWRDLSKLAEQLALEALSAETEILSRPDLHGMLALPGVIQRFWRRPADVQIGTERDVRIIRFDFHFTTEGWRISEANIDTPAGLIEASGFARQMLAHYSNVRLAGDPAALLAHAIRQNTKSEALVTLIHATAYSDDRQIMLFLSQLLEREGLRTCLISPAQLQWRNGQARLDTDWQQDSVDYMLRFFPAEWLPNLPRHSQWQCYFNNCCVPATNPTSTLLIQTKRFPVIWDRLQTPLPTWKSLLPETCDPRSIHKPIKDEWVYKPAFGRAGEDVAIPTLTSEKQWKATQRTVHRHAKHWIAQRRFEAVPIQVNGTAWYPCFGVYTVNGQAAGVYGRIATQPLIDHTTKEIAVFVAEPARE